jgi:hypothetical protein
MDMKLKVYEEKQKKLADMKENEKNQDDFCESKEIEEVGNLRRI